MLKFIFLKLAMQCIEHLPHTKQETQGNIAHLNLIFNQRILLYNLIKSSCSDTLRYRRSLAVHASSQQLAADGWLLYMEFHVILFYIKKAVIILFRIIFISFFKMNECGPH